MAFISKFKSRKKGIELVQISELPATHVGSNPVTDEERLDRYIYDRTQYYNRADFDSLDPEAEGISLLTTLWGEEGLKQNAILVTRAIATSFPQKILFFEQMEQAIVNY